MVFVQFGAYGGHAFEVVLNGLIVQLGFIAQSDVQFDVQAGSAINLVKHVQNSLQ